MRHLNEGNIYKNFLLQSIPLVLTGFLGQAYNLIDTMIAGIYLGENGLAAVGATAGFTSLIHSIFVGWSMAFAVVVGRLFGASDYEKIKHSFYSFVVIYAAYILLSCIGLIALYRPIFSLLNVPAEIWNEARNYYAIYLISFLFSLPSHVCTGCMNAFGESRTPFFFMIVSTVLNIGGNVLTVAILGWGTIGLAISTLFASIVVFACNQVKLHLAFKKLGVVTRAKISFKHVKGLASYGVPIMFQQAASSLGSAVISPLVNSYGTTATAGYSIANQLFNFNAYVYWNSSTVVQYYTSQCLGAKEYHKIRKGVKVGLLQNYIFTLPFLLITIFAPHLICKLFFKNPDSQGLLYAVHFARYFMPFAVFSVFDSLFHCLFRSIKAMDKLVISNLIYTGVRILVSFILAKFYGIYGVFAGYVIGWVIESIYITIVYCSGKWIPKKLRKEYKEACQNAKEAANF